MRIVISPFFFLLFGGAGKAQQVHDMTPKPGTAVHVRDEPRHHNVFENEFVRVLDVYLPPGDTTQYHLHHTPSVFVFLTSTRTTSQLSGQAPATGLSVANTAQFDSLSRQRVHRVWNDDSTWFHVMDIELVAGKPKTEQPLFANARLKLLFTEALVNGYKWSGGKDARLNLPASAAGYLLTSFGKADLSVEQNGAQQTRMMKSGHYAWIAANTTANIQITGEAPDGFLLLQLK